MTKTQMLKRIGIILHSMRKMTNPSQFDEMEIDIIHNQLNKIEEQWAAIVDDLMASKYKEHNRIRNYMRKIDEYTKG